MFLCSDYLLIFGMIKCSGMKMILMAATLLLAANAADFHEEDYPVRQGSLDEMQYSPQATSFHLWSPKAEKVRVLLYEEGQGGQACDSRDMALGTDGTWHVTVPGDLRGKFYAFHVRIDGKWLGETPGIFAKAVGIGGRRGAVIDLAATDPEGWAEDRSPAMDGPASVIVYEMHHRDFSIHPSSGIVNKGKFLALTEEGTTSPEGLPTGLDHLKDLGVTHVHILPSFDFSSIDETALGLNRYNWGYDPLNYNVPEGSYSTDPARPEVRIREFKQMVQALHRNGLRVVLDVVYNHTSNARSSAFERTAPGYFYRLKPDGTFANGSGCGNETAPERPMMRKYMVESVLYWMREYHIDGFRFDLMGVHDIATMNAIREAACQVDPQVFIYGEGWAAETPLYEADSLAMKGNAARMPGIAAFSDEMRDALRGPWDDDAKGAFLAGKPGDEESLKFGLAGAVSHPQVQMDKVNYSTVAWAAQPTQMISYVSCHDDMCLADRLKASVPDLRPGELERLDMLAQTAVLTSQGVPFLFAGEEVLRDKKGVHNSYRSPDDINAIDWNNKAAFRDVYAYYKGMIALRKHHPAFRLGDADLVRKHLEFLPVEGSGLVVFRLKDHAGGDSWQEIVVVLNARREAASVRVGEGRWTAVVKDGKVREDGLGVLAGPVLTVGPESALIVWKEDR